MTMVHQVGARAPLALALVGSAIALGTCTCDAPPPPLPPVELDVVLGAGEVRCGPVATEADLIGGPGAFGQPGRSFRCNNSRIRFLVQDGSRPVANSSEGGTLLDVDLVRGTPGEREADGQDTFRELVPGIGAQEARVASIEVLNDGRNGEPGVIRVTGTPTPITLAPQADYLAQEFEGTVVTDYILKPDASYVEVASTLKNSGPPLPSIQAADFVAFGGSTNAHSQEFGYGGVELFSQIAFLSAGRGDVVNYALASPDSDIIVPFIDAGVTAPFYGPGVPVGSERTFVRWLVVGDGSLESTTRQVMEMKQLARGTVTGVVHDAAGAAVPGAIVSALSAPLAEENTRVVNEARTAADGTYTLTLPPGAFTLVAHGGGRVRSAEQPVTVADGGSATASTLVIGATGRIAVTTTFTDRAGGDLGARPAKLTLVPRGDTQRPNRVLLDFSEQGASSYHVSADGTFAADVAPGSYTAYVTRGFEFSRFEEEIDVVAGQTVTVNASIAHVLDTTGLVGAEFHQHSLASVDATVPVATKVLENAAEGVEMAASTDHDVITDFRPHVQALGLAQHLFVVAGAEVSYQAIGHFNAYPWNVDVADPFRDNGSSMWWLKTVPEMFADVRAAAGDPIIQINHPRSGLTGYFTALPFNPIDGRRIPRDPSTLSTLPPNIYEEWANDFDAVEVNSGLGNPELFTLEGRAELERRALQDSESVPNLADYLALLGAGLKVVATGNSDTHDADEGVGYPRNFLLVNKDDAATLTEDDLRVAVRAQRNAVGEGCLVELFAAGARKQGIAEMIAPDDAVTVRLQAPAHVSPGSLEVYVNGEARKLVVTADAITLDDTGVVAPPVSSSGSTDEITRVDHALAGLPSGEGDLVVIVASQGGSGLAPTGGGSAMCYSAPLYVDVNGDGAFTPWLADTQDIAD